MEEKNDTENILRSLIFLCQLSKDYLKIVFQESNSFSILCGIAGKAQKLSGQWLAAFRHLTLFTGMAHASSSPSMKCSLKNLIGALMFSLPLPLIKPTPQFRI